MVPTVRASLATVALAGALALGAAADYALLAGGLAIVVLIFAFGAVRSSTIAAARPVALLAASAGLIGLAWTYVAETPDLIPMVSVLGPSLVLAIVIQLARRNGRPALTSSLAASVSACVLAVLPVMWLAMWLVNDVGNYAVELGLLGVGVVAVLESVPIARAVRRVIGVVLSAGIASALGMVAGEFGDAVPPVSALVVAALAGLMAAVAFAVTDRVAGEAPVETAQVPVTVPDDGSAAERAEYPPAAGATLPAPWITPLCISLPVIAAGPVVYVLGRLLIELPS